MKAAIPMGLIACAVLWHVAAFRLAPKIGLLKPNFQKRPVMASYGVASFGYTAALIGSIWLMSERWIWQAPLYLWVMAAMWTLGAVDDFWGSREVGGFAGHFRKLFTRGKVTTGAVKAIGGGIVGIVAGYIISEGVPVQWALAAVLIPLAANVLNLFDLRPGRAAAVFFLGLGVTYLVALGSIQTPWIVAAVAVTALAWAIPDSLGKAMMGDSGSNSLGAALGITMSLNTGIVFQSVVILAIIALHLYSESHSITGLIERNHTLNWIDRRLGVR